MQFSELWARLILKNSKLLNDEAKVEMTVKQFKAQLRQAYEQGEGEQNKSSGPTDVFDIFGGIFNNKKG